MTIDDTLSHLPKPTALIVHAHPEPDSFTSEQMRTAEASLRVKGYEIRTIDLYRLGWSPVLDRSNFTPEPEYFKPQAEQMAAVKAGTLPADVGEHLDALLHADLLVLSFPLWWFSVPAILKGWIDKIFVMGATFGGDHGLFDQAALSGHRAVLLITTGGSAESFGEDCRFGDLETLLFHIHHGMLRFVGYDVLEPVVTYGPAHQSEFERRDSLSAVAAAFREIAIRPALNFGNERSAA